jgi:hypothetical protein
MTMILNAQIGIRWSGTKTTGSKSINNPQQIDQGLLHAGNRGTTMKQYLILPTIIMSALLAAPAIASVATIPNEFEAGERARAGEVNENFLSVKDAVDDNHSRINTLENQVKEVGAASVSSHAFTSFTPTCDYRRSQNYGYFLNTGLSCIAIAPIALPHYATIIGASCLLYDSEVTPRIFPAALIRTNLAIDTSNEEIFIADPTSSVGNAIVYNMSEMPISGGDVVDNGTYAYYISVTFDGDSLSNSTNLRLYSCKVNYSLDNLN